MLTSDNPTFFTSECYFYSYMTNWAENYLYRENYRITEMVLPILKSDFLNFYGLTLQTCVKNNWLMLRAKLYNEEQNNICLFQIWESKKCYESFLKKIEAIKFEKAIKSTGLWFEKNITESVSLSFLHEQIEQMKFKKVIWQFVNTEFEKPWMTVGDPIRNKGLK